MLTKVVRRSLATTPAVRPACPNFSSGPCAKRPGWSPAVYATAATGRSHRSKLGKKKLEECIERTRAVLGVPADYKVGIVPASDTGAMEMMMWSCLGSRPVDACHWESFGKGWFADMTKQLKLENVREFTADYGSLPDLTQTSPEHDVVFTFNGTTSGVRVPDLEWVSAERKGLTFNDATSAVFAMDVDWSKCDVTTFSWQKVLGGEGAHGVLVLSPRAVERLETYTPPNRPLPKIFQLTKNNKLIDGIFQGATINTPSLVAVEDCLDALKWAESIGGLPALIQRSNANLAVLEAWVSRTPWAHFLAEDPNVRSNTSVCLTLDADPKAVKALVTDLEAQNVAYDIGSYRDAPPGLRIWCGATVEASDLEKLLPWLDFAYAQHCGSGDRI